MSTLDHPKTATLPPLVAGQRLDRATFHARYEVMPASTRAELIGGIVHVPSPLSNDHAEGNVAPVVWLDHYVEFTPGLRLAINPSTFLDDESEPQPDVTARIPAELGGQSRIEAGYIAGAPELVIEIARSSRRIDLGPKKADYERAGVLEYVVFELDPDRVHWFVRRGDRFEPLRPGPDGLYRAEVFPGLWLDPVALFAGDRARLRAVVDRGLATPEHAAFVARLEAARRHRAENGEDRTAENAERKTENDSANDRE
ncbi:MAG TPA: Uma2 family endonuclease [Isosphaeraceae bacterium]|jgi:Uma2 family endonuclease